MNTADRREQRRLLGNWRAERDSAVLYAALARLAPDAEQRSLYLALTDSERGHAAFWEERLRALGVPIPVFRPSARTAILTQLVRLFGAGFVVPSVITREMRDRDEYSDQRDACEAGLARDEHGHAAVLRGRSQAAIGNNLRAAVLGANDGLASNFCLMMGIAGAGASPTSVLLTGIAGLTAGAASMALGEWLSVTNARELALSQLDRAMEARAPYAEHPDVAGAGDARSAAAFSFGLFALGALFPLLPFAVLRPAGRIAGSIASSVAALFLLGLATSLFNGRSALFSGLRQMLIGVGAAGGTYLIGRAFGGLLG